MPSFDYLNLIVLIITASAALGFFYLQRKTHSQDQTNQDTQEKSYELLHQAIQKAQNIVSVAELDAIKAGTDTRFYREKLENQFQGELENASKLTRELMKDEAARVEKEFTDYLATLRTSLDKNSKDFVNYLSYLKTDSDAQRNNNAESIRQQVSEIFVKFEDNLSQFLMDTQQKSVQSIELELKAARGLIETYKQQQLKLIDENIVAMLEKTLSLVLTKKLSLTDQVELAYEALEKAKAEKFIV